MERFFDVLFSMLGIASPIPLLVLIMLVLKATGEERYFFCKSESVRVVKCFTCINLPLC